MEDLCIQFENHIFGLCNLQPVKDCISDDSRRLLQDPSIMKLTSLGDNEDRTCSDQRIDDLWDQSMKRFKRYRLGMYEIVSPDLNFLGIAAYFIERDQNGHIAPEICLYLTQAAQRKRLGTDVAKCMVEYAFQVTICDCIVADAFPMNPSLKILKRLGFDSRDRQTLNLSSDDSRQVGQMRCTLTRDAYLQQRKYLFLQKLHKAGVYSLCPSAGMETHNMERVRKLFFSNFSGGVLLSTGGSTVSFITIHDLTTRNIATFNEYRSDRRSSTQLTQEAMKKFLQEEGPLRDVAPNSIDVVFSFGSHEGLMRLARCIYHSSRNNGIFYCEGSYGFVVCGLATMKPVPYLCCAVPVDHNNGEKLCIQGLKDARKRNPTFGSLILEVKTIAGSIYTKDDLVPIIKFCKDNNIFIMFDIAHYGMDFVSLPANTISDVYRQNLCTMPHVVHLCQQIGFHRFGVVYTASKVYGLERARVGLIILDASLSLGSKVANDVYRVIGSANDLPFEVASCLFATSIEARLQHKQRCGLEMYENLQILLAYIHGFPHSVIDPLFTKLVEEEIPIECGFRQGIPLIGYRYIPEGGSHMKLMLNNLVGKYFYNIEIFNSEVFAYLLHTCYGVTVLHSFQVLDPCGTTLRISFGFRGDLHRGMRAIANLTRQLTDSPRAIEASTESTLTFNYLQTFQAAAAMIQRFWKKTRMFAV